MSFESVHHMIKAEKVLKEAGISVYPMPTPREIAISCGQCLLFMSHEEKKLLKALAEAKVRWSKLFSRIVSKGTYSYEKQQEYGG